MDGMVAKAQTSRRSQSGAGPSVLVLAGGGVSHVSGGVGTLLRYLETAWIGQCDAPRLVVQDTRGAAGVVGAAWTFARAMGAVLRHGLFGDTELVHAHMTTRGSVWRKCMLCGVARVLGMTTVIHQHGADFQAYFRAQRPAVRWMIRRTLNAAARVVVLGAAWKNFLVDEVGVSADCVQIILNGVPRPTALHLRRVNLAAPHILFLGRLGERKGVPELLAAFGHADLRGRSWHATLAGDGEVDRYRDVVREAGLADRIDILGWQDGASKDALLRRADILVLPSHHEAMPLAVLEAMAHGIAVITTPVGAVPEFLADGHNALLVAPGDVTQLAAALARLLDDQTLRAELGQVGHATFLQRLDITAVAEDTARLYREALACRSADRRAA